MKYWRYLHNADDYECAGIYGDFQGVFDTLEEAQVSGLDDLDTCFILVVENNIPVKSYCWVGNGEWHEAEIKNGELYGD